jgi:hypothetical protein
MRPGDRPGLPSVRYGRVVFSRRDGNLVHWVKEAFSAGLTKLVDGCP